jgi:pullulanase/glycogen debranching enzyme
MRNMAASLLLAHGVPMLQMGDEYGHSKVGGMSDIFYRLWGGGVCGSD